MIDAKKPTSAKEVRSMWHKALKKAVETYGVQSQMIIAVEEMSELTKEISKNIRGQDNLDHMAEEIADVEIIWSNLRLRSTFTVRLTNGIAQSWTGWS